MSLSSTKNRASAQGGFSLIELLVVVLIIGILAAIMIPRFLGQRDSANNSQSISALTNAKTAAEAVYQANGESYGATSAALAASIAEQEPSLDGAAAYPNASLPAPPNGVPTDIYVNLVGGAARDATAYLCSVSKGTKSFCVKLPGTGKVEYLGVKTTALPAAGSLASAAGWNADPKTAGFN